MWNMIQERFPDFSDWGYAFFSFIVPYSIYKVNQKLHKDLDPPWKRQEKQKQKDQKQPSN